MIELVIASVVVVVAIAIAGSAVRVINEYERGVVFRLGRLAGVRAPGMRVIGPLGIDRLVKVDLRTVTVEAALQDAMTADSVTVQVRAVIYFHVSDPSRAVMRVVNHFTATSQAAQSVMLGVTAQTPLRELLGDRDGVGVRTRRALDQQTAAWGVTVAAVEIKEVELPESMRRAMARQAEAEGDRRAMIIQAQAEWDAAQRLAQAAQAIAVEPGAMQLRYLQTIADMRGERSTVIVLPMPVDAVTPLFPARTRASVPAAAPPPAPPAAAAPQGRDEPRTATAPAPQEGAQVDATTGGPGDAGGPPDRAEITGVRVTPSAPPVAAGVTGTRATPPPPPPPPHSGVSQRWHSDAIAAAIRDVFPHGPQPQPIAVAPRGIPPLTEPGRPVRYTEVDSYEAETPHSLFDTDPASTVEPDPHGAGPRQQRRGAGEGQGSPWPATPADDDPGWRGRDSRTG